MSASRKPIVGTYWPPSSSPKNIARHGLDHFGCHIRTGHNLLLDILLSYSHFEDRLPSTFREFKLKVNRLFPVIFDTKYIATYDPAYKVPVASNLKIIIDAFASCIVLFTVWGGGRTYRIVCLTRRSATFMRQ